MNKREVLYSSSLPSDHGFRFSLSALQSSNQTYTKWSHTTCFVFLFESNCLGSKCLIYGTYFFNYCKISLIFLEFYRRARVGLVLLQKNFSAGRPVRLHIFSAGLKFQPRLRRWLDRLCATFICVYFLFQVNIFLFQKIKFICFN